MWGATLRSITSCNRSSIGAQRRVWLKSRWQVCAAFPTRAGQRGPLPDPWSRAADLFCDLKAGHADLKIGQTNPRCSLYCGTLQQKPEKVSELHTSSFMRILGVTWKVLSIKAAPPFPHHCRLGDVGKHEKGGVAAIHLFLSQNHRPPPVLPWDKGRPVHSADMWHDSRSTFCQWKQGLSIKTGSGRVLLLPKSVLRGPTEVCLARPALHRPLWAVLVVWTVGADAAQACDAITHIQKHYL